MRSFEGFLVGYCADLTGVRTTSVKRLAELCEDFPRAEEPALLLAAALGRLGYMARCAEGKRVGERARALSDVIEGGASGLSAYLDGLDDADRLKKPYLSWLSERGRTDRDRRVSAAMAERTLSVIREAGLKRSQVAAAAGIDKGSFYAWLSGAEGKVSRERARKAFEAASALSARPGGPPPLPASDPGIIPSEESFFPGSREKRSELSTRHL